MKKIIKNRVFLVIITALICITGSVYASQIFANNIRYTPEWKAQDGSNITNVEQAMNELYNKASVNNNITIFDRVGYVNDTKNGSGIHSITVPESGTGMILMSSYGSSHAREIVITYDGVEKYRGTHKVGDDYYPTFLAQFPVEKGKNITVVTGEDWNEGWHKVALFVF